MEFDFSVEKKPVAMPSIALRSVWSLHADQTYYVKKSRVPYNDLIALKTIGGSGKIKIDGQNEITTVPGTLVIFSYSSVRYYYCTDEKWDFWWFEFNTRDVFTAPLNTLLTVNPAANEMDHCISCMKLLKKGENNSSSLASATFCLLLFSWLHNIKSNVITNPHYEVIRAAIDDLRSDIHHTATVGDLAEKAGLCDRRFRQVFKNITGSNPKAYIENVRIGLAEELLRNTSLSVIEITSRLGYSSQFHFSKAFKRYHGIPPSNYRKTITDK